MTELSETESGPGVLSTDDVGTSSIAKTTLIDTRVAMAYAAGINDTNPAYFDDLQKDGVHVHPCIAFSLQWNSRFRLDQAVNLRAAPFGVHASTDLRIYRPFRVGEAITTQGTVLEKRQLTPGVYTVDRYRMTASDGFLVAELYYNGITRGATLAQGNAKTKDEPAWPDFGSAAVREASVREVLWQSEIPVSLHLGQQYTECARIYNPIHTEPSVAKAAGLPDMILHGSATKALSLSAVINQYFDGDSTRITRLCGQLRGMVLMDSKISVEVLAVDEHADEKKVLFRTRNAAGQAAISNGIVCGKA